MIVISLPKLIAVGCLGVALVAGPPQLEARGTLSEKRETVNGPGKLELSGGLSQNDAEIGKTVRFWMTVHNAGKRNLYAIHVTQLHLGGARLKRVSWLLKPAGACSMLFCGVQQPFL